MDPDQDRYSLNYKLLWVITRYVKECYFECDSHTIFIQFLFYIKVIKMLPEFMNCRSKVKLVLNFMKLFFILVDLSFIII